MAVHVEKCEDEFLVLRRIKKLPTTRSQRSPSSEIEDYLCEEPVIRGQKLNPLEYWKVKECQGELRGLCRLAKRAFCASPTTAAVERIFSITGFVFSGRRASLSDDMFEFLLFNHLNSDLRTFGAIVDEIVNGRKRKFKDIS